MKRYLNDHKMLVAGLLGLGCVLAWTIARVPRPWSPALHARASDEASAVTPVAAGRPAAARLENYGKLPLYFVENRGQLDARVAYYVQGRDKSIYFTSRGVTYALTGGGEAKSEPRVRQVGFRQADWVGAPMEAPASQRWAVKLDFVGGAKEVTPAGEERAAAVVSYFKGPREDWKAGLPTYSSVVYRQLWPGIDLRYSGTVNRLKYEFVIQPGASPEAIRLAYRGAEVRLNGEGELEVTTPAGGFRDEKPYAYQEAAGRREEVAAAYALGAGQEYGFHVGAYDPSRPLVLDPAVLVYAGYIGGSGSHEGADIAVDGSGNAYVTGITTSTEATFPVTVGPDLTFNGGGFTSDAFVAKVNAAGTALVYAGYIGGSGFDYGIGIAVDGSGNAYVTGITTSTEAAFPVTVGPDLTYNGGSFDGFVAKVNTGGTALVYAGYIGGSSFDVGSGIAVDGAGNAYVTGHTNSTEATFPGTVGPDLTYDGGVDAFVAKVNAGGTALVYAGYIGGSGHDVGVGIAVDGSGNAYVTGSTTSTEATFPETVGPDLTSNGGEDAFVAKVNAAGTALVYAGYIGGSSFDRGLGIAVDGSGNAYVTGQTFSNEGAFPETVGPDLTFNGGDYDAFVAKVNAAGTALGYAGYIGGSGDDVGIGIAVDGSGNAYVAGWTFSTEGTFPETVGPDLTFNGGAFDAFVAKVNAAGTALVYAGYIGGSGEDHGAGIAVDGSGNAYVTGSTSSTEATFPVTVGPDLTSNANGGYSDAFVAKISPSIQVAPTASPTQLPAANGAGWNNSDVTVTWNWADNAGGSGIDPANCTTTSLSSGEGASLILNATCKDLAGNTGNASYTVKVDKTNPSIAASAAKADSTPYTFGTWTNQTVTVHFTCSDSGGSGVATCSADQVLSVDGVTSLNGTTTDNAGNSASSSFVLIQVDKTNPAITASATKADSTPYIAGTWTNQTVTVHFTCGDPGGSGVATCSADQVLSADGVTASVNGTATDNAGNSANASFGPVQVDKTNPSLAAPPAVTVNPTGPSGAVVSNATLGTATVSDNLTPSPVVTVSGIPAGNLFPIGTTTLTYTATDLAGNSTMAIQAVTVRSVSTLLAQLMAAVNALPGSTGMRTSLLGHLDNTQKDLANGNMSGACAQMATFILQVSVFQANGSISPAQAASLIADATAARAALGCP